MKKPLSAGFAAGIIPPFAGDPWQWLEEHVRLPHSARSTRVDRNQSPWLQEILHAVMDERVTQISVRACTGGGKTTLLEMLVPWIVAQQPGPMLLVGQTGDTVKEWMETRLLGVLKACKPVEALFPNDRHAVRKTEILFPHMPLLAVPANLSNAQEKSMRYVYLDECWQYKPGMIGEFKRRHHDRANRKTIMVSQGSFEDDETDLEFKSGEIFEWGTTCESCGQWHKYLWESIRYEEPPKEEEVNWRKLRESVKHVCPHCAWETPNTVLARRAMSSRGSYQSQGGNFIPGHKSFTFPAHAVWWIDWADLVVLWVKANLEKNRGNLEPLRQFRQKQQAKPWEKQSEAPAIALEAGAYRKADFADGQPIDGEVARIMAIDRQQDHYWGAVRAWRPDGSSRLIWEGKILTVETIRALQLQLKVKDKLVFMDSQFETQKSWEECARFGWSALHGSGQKGFDHIGRNATVKRFFSPAKVGKALSGATCRYFFWANEGIKDQLVMLRRKGPPMWEFPEDVSKDYLFQLNSEVKKDVVNKRTGAVKREYVKFRDNHLWDCEAMITAAAAMLGLLPDLAEEELTEGANA